MHCACRSTRSKSKGKVQTRATGTRGGRGSRRKVSTLPPTPSIILTSTAQTSQLRNDARGSKPPSPDLPTTVPASTDPPASSADVASKHSQPTPDTSATGGATGPPSPAKESEDPLLLPSSPKTPKRDSPTPHHSPSLSTHPAPSPPGRTASVRTPGSARPRMNLAERMKLVSAVPPTLSLESSDTRRSLISSTCDKVPVSHKASATCVPSLSAKELAQPTQSERQTHRKKSVPTSSSSSSSTVSDSADSIRKLYRLSVKELAQQTEPERRMSARVAAARGRGKSPATPTPRTPQLQQFKSFVVESPTKSPR